MIKDKSNQIVELQEDNKKEKLKLRNKMSFGKKWDQIWKNFATLAKIWRVFGNSFKGLFGIWQFSPYFGICL